MPDNEDPKPAPAPALRPVLDSSATPVFASLLNDFSFDGPNIHLSFATQRFNPVTNLADHFVITSRIVMSVASARQMLDFLSKGIVTAELNSLPMPDKDSLQ